MSPLPPGLVAAAGARGGAAAAQAAAAAAAAQAAAFGAFNGNAAAAVAAAAAAGFPPAGIGREFQADFCGDFFIFSRNFDDMVFPLLLFLACLPCLCGISCRKKKKCPSKIPRLSTYLQWKKTANIQFAALFGFLSQTLFRITRAVVYAVSQALVCP